MTRLAIATAKRIADLGYTAAVIGPNEIQTDAPETICGIAVNAAIMAEGPFTERDPTIRRRKRRAAKTAAPAPRRRRRTRRRPAKLRTIRKVTRRRRKLRKSDARMERMLKRLPITGMKRRAKRRRKGRKLTGAAKAAFIARMRGGRK